MLHFEDRFEFHITEKNVEVHAILSLARVLSIVYSELTFPVQMPLKEHKPETPPTLSVSNSI